MKFKPGDKVKLIHLKTFGIGEVLGYSRVYYSNEYQSIPVNLVVNFGDKTNLIVLPEEHFKKVKK